jgi:Mlc titration factor MtfA (ptsG expression regulator)/Tfp pilus assembly protein PilF
MGFTFLRQDRRQQLLAEPFPEDWLAYLQDNVFLYRVLSEAEQARLRDAVRIFVDEKYWEGCGGLEITDEIKVTIAAQACLLLLGFDDFYFEKVYTILVYPGGCLAKNLEEETDQVELVDGEAHRSGPVVLSWWQACWEGRWPGRGNLVIHEFAHQLDFLNDTSDGVPPIDDADFERRMRKVMRAEFRRLCEDASYDRPTLLDPSGADDPAEFFAVATECFFLQPARLRRQHPRLYQVLAEWYRQDPTQWRTPDEEDSVRARAAEEQYDRQIIAECNQAIRLHPELVEAFQGRAAALCRRGEYDQALADYTTIIEVVPDDPDAYCDRGSVYLAQGCHDQAIADFNAALRACPDYARAYYERGLAYVDRDDLDQALADLTRAIAVDPGDDAAYLERGLVHLEREDYEGAIRDFTKAIRLFPHGADAYSHRARAHLGRKEYERAIADCNKALRIEPNLPEAYHDRGVGYYHQGAVDRAIADCTEALRLDPEYAEAYRARALAYAARGEEEQAQEDRARAEELDAAP